MALQVSTIMLVSMIIPIGLTLLSLRGMIKSMRFRPYKLDGTYEKEPAVLVIMPCKGEDIRFEETLKAIKRQDYDNYKLVAVVDSKNDAAYAPLMKHRIKTIITDSKISKTTNCSGKNRAIITCLELYAGDFDIFMVLDSDTTVMESWLQRLIAPLIQDRNVGLTTTFPLFYPISGFWSRVKTVWGLVGTSMQSDKRTIFAWGGSMAFRAGIVSAAIKELSNSTADDIALGKACSKRGLGIVAVPEARPLVYVKETFGTFAEWSIRQTALSILGNGMVFRYGMIYYSAFCINNALLLLLLYGNSPLSIIFILPILMNMLGFNMQTKMLNPLYYLIVAFMPLVYAIDLLIGKRTRSIRWRGSDYKLA